MKKIIFFLFGVTLFFSVYSQTIPIGISLDSIKLNLYQESSINDYESFQRFYYYKPATYNSLTSPILFAVHGDGGDGLSPLNDLIDIAERRSALIISFHMIVFNTNEPVDRVMDSLRSLIYHYPATFIFKDVYKHVLFRENRINISSYLIGFSAGGQFVSRYMLFRQAYRDSIPIVKALACSGYYYTIPTDSIGGEELPYMSGFAPNIPYFTLCPTSDPNCTYTSYNALNFYTFFSNDHKIQYYNDNFCILVGTGDIANLVTNPSHADSVYVGLNRYERAKHFYNFCDTNATNMGTTLKWRIDTVVGVGHDQYAIFNTKRNVTDTSTIAESLLFDTPYHETIDTLVPLADFSYSKDTVYLPNATVQFINKSKYATSYLWDFGDGTTSTDENPTHTYSQIPMYPYGTNGSYSVHLMAFNDRGAKNWRNKPYCINIQNSTSNNTEISKSHIFNVFPNPATNEVKFNYQTDTNSNNLSIEIYDAFGRLFKSLQLQSNYGTIKLQTNQFSSGVYFVKFKINGVLINIEKLFIIH